MHHLSSKSHNTPICNMYSGNPSLPWFSSARGIIDQQRLQLSTTDNPMAAYIHGDFSNIRMDMDIGDWTCETRPQSFIAMSYSSGGQPPSIGNVRQIVVSEPSGSSNQISSDGQPPSVNDICRREASESEASCTRHEGPDEYEVQQVTSKPNDGVYKRETYSGYEEPTQDLVSRFDSKVSQSFVVPPMTFNSIDFAINENGFLNLFSPPQRFPQMRTYTKVSKRGTVGRCIDITAFTGYNQLIQQLAQIFGIEGQLDNQQGIGWKLVYVDHENDILLVGPDPWEEFVNYVQSIMILSLQEIQQMSLDADFGGNSVVPNQACSSSVVEQFNGRTSFQLF